MTVTPPTGRTGTTFEVTFQVDEALAAPPDVRVDLGFRLEPGEDPEGDGPATGVELLVWRGARWERIGRRDDGLDAGGDPALGTLSWSSEEADSIDAVLFGDGPTLDLALLPTSPNGAETARVWTDYVEVRVRYELPPP